MNDHPEWNDSRYFNFYDKGSDIMVFMRIGNKPNKNEKSMFMFVVKDGLVAGMLSNEPVDNDKWFAKGLRFKKDDKVWHITYDGYIATLPEKEPHKFSMDIVWDPINPNMDYKLCVDEVKAAMSSKVVSEHFEQFGHVTGKIAIDGVTVDLDAYGERDCSEGVREWDSPKMWFWLNSVYDGRYGFNMTKLCTDAGDVDAGYFSDGNVNHPIVSTDIELINPAGIPQGYKMTMTDTDGNKYAVDAEIVRYAVLPRDGGMLLVETLSKTQWNGMTGYGVAEFLVPGKR